MELIYKIVSLPLYIFSWLYYSKYISTIFYGIPGYYFIDISWNKIILSISLLSLIVIILDSNIKSISDLFLMGVIYIIYIPLICLISNFLLFIMIIFNILILALGWKKIKTLSLSKEIKRIRISKSKYIFLWFLLIFLIISFIKFIGIRTKLDFSYSLYEIRSVFKESYSGLSVYVLTLSEYFLIPLILFLFIRSKKILLKIFLLIICIFIILQIFFVSALKSSIFIVFYLILGYIFLRNRKSFNFFKAVILFSAFLILIVSLHPKGIIGYLIDHSLRRFLISPVLNAYYHISYTVENYGLLNIGNRKNMGEIISKVYYNTYGNAPAGLSAGDFSRFGTLGLILFPFVFLLFLSLLKNLSTKLKLSEQFILFGYYLYVLINTSFITSFVTYGLLFMILLVYFLNKRFKL